jgi:hypothetical protein
MEKNDINTTRLEHWRRNTLTKYRGNIGWDVVSQLKCKC